MTDKPETVLHLRRKLSLTRDDLSVLVAASSILAKYFLPKDDPNRAALLQAIRRARGALNAKGIWG